MYLDSYVISGLIIVAATCVILGYMGYHAYRHIKQDMEKNSGK